jgi:hypothetical protein
MIDLSKTYLGPLNLCLLATLAFVSGSGFAVSPEVWRTSSYAEFAQGEAEKVSILNPGDIRLAPSFHAYSKIPESGVWSLLESRDGKTLYAGTGNRARVYKIAADAESATAEAQVFADLDGNAIYAMTEGADGFLYAGVSPGGNVYKIGPDGAVTLVGDTGRTYVWAMVFDSNGDLILATGDKGELVRLAMEGKSEKILATEEKHLLSLVTDDAGNYFFGTAPNGWVCLLKADGDFVVLYDSELSEVKALAIDDEKNVFAGIVPTVKVEPKNDNQPAASPKTSSESKSSELVKIEPSGLALSLLKTDNAAINALYSNEEGLLIGTGEEGKLFRLGYRNNADLVAKVESGDILSLGPRKAGGHWMAAANPGVVYLLPAGTQEGGIFASKALDAGVSAQWGNFHWLAEVPEGATLDFQTRSGNTKEPDDNWSEWSDPLVEPGTVTSGPARYLQWRSRFGGSGKGVSAVVKEVEVVYQKINQPPLISALKTGTDSKTSGSTASSSSDGKSDDSTKTSGDSKNGSSSSLSISWQAADANGDDLLYDLHYRRVGESLWKEIETDTDSAKYTWKTESLPDGDYEVRVTASDRGDNPDNLSSADEWISEPVRLDRTAPEFGEWKNATVDGKAYTVEVRIGDKTSRLVKVDRVVDGDEDEARPLLSTDGILDTSTEDFEIRIEDLESGEHSLTVRAEDELGNLGASSTVFTIP